MNAPTVHNNSTYQNHGCRCDVCRRAHADYQRGANERRHRRLADGTVQPEHGKASTYQNYGCRCQLCTKANSAARPAQYHRGT